jgi:ankyrin repeat protein
LVGACQRGQKNAIGTALSDNEISIVKRDRLAIVQLLVEAGANVNFTVQPIKMTALHWAAFNGDSATCAYLLDVGASVTFSSQD